MATATAQQPLVDMLYATLTAVTALNTAVGGRIYDTSPEQDAALPFVLVNIIADPPQMYFTSDDILMEFQVDIYNKLEAGGKATRIIADMVYGALNRATPTPATTSGYTGCSILCTDRGNGMDQDLIIGARTQQDASRITQSYRLFGTGT